jgi:hypothetical protein
MTILWAAHYFLITGYDDASQTFHGQDTFHGPDQSVSYAHLDEQWKIFNRVYILVYPPSQEETVKSILGDHWDVKVNREHALEVAQAETEATPRMPMPGLTWAPTWFTSSVIQMPPMPTTRRATWLTPAHAALPVRAIFRLFPYLPHRRPPGTDRLRSPEDAEFRRGLLWRGWGRYRSGDKGGAIEDFNAALEANHFYTDAQYALNFVSANP